MFSSSSVAPSPRTIFRAATSETPVRRASWRRRSVSSRSSSSTNFVLSLGCSLHNVLTSFNPTYIRKFQSKIYQVEVNADRLSVFSRYWIHADLGDVLTQLPHLERSTWFHEEQENSVVDKLLENILALGEVLRERYANKVVYFGVGNSCIWLPYALGSDIKKSISRSGSMGGIAAGLTRQENPVLVLGDGEFEMDLSLLTEAQYRVDRATIFVVNNKRLGLVTEQQKQEFGSILTPKRDPINYDKTGNGFKNVESYSVSEPNEVKPVSDQAMEADKISVVEIETDKIMTEDMFSLFKLPGIDP